MGRRRKFGRPVNGVLIVDKPAGATSNAVLQRAKRLFFAEKAGHTGSLDPLATGVLPLCFGEATKFSQYLLESDKVYESTFRFGETTDTADADGEVIARSDASFLTAKQVEKALERYRGDIEQMPPMYSALKKNGQPLYKLAREGIEVEREKRHVSVYELTLLEFRPGNPAEADVRVSCSKGTYVRSLAQDLGSDLNTGGHVARLRRTQAGPFTIQQSLSLDTLEQERGEGRAEQLDHYLLPVDAPLDGVNKLVLDDTSGFYFLRGQAVMATEVYRIGDEGDTVRVFQASGEFLGTGEITDEGTVAPKRLISSRTE